jgi:hypothetical protein
MPGFKLANSGSHTVHSLARQGPRLVAKTACVTPGPPGAARGKGLGMGLRIGHEQAAAPNQIGQNALGEHRAANRCQG